MYVYLFNILILITSWFISRCVTYKKATENVDYSMKSLGLFCAVSSLNWIILSGFRHVSIGADTLAYKHMFEQMESYSWDQIGLDFKTVYLYGGSDIKDPGYQVIEKIFHMFSNDYQMFLLFIAIVFFVPFGFFIYKNSRHALLSYVLFSCLFYGFYAVTGQRQTIATAIAVLIGFVFIKKRKLIPFLLCVLLASTIHKSALCFLPLYWLSKIKITKISSLVYCVAILLAYINRYPLLSVLQNLVGYSSYTDLEGAAAGVFVYFLLFVILIITLFSERIQATTSDSNTLNITMTAIYLAGFFSALLLINPAFMRVVQYYSIFLVLIIPEFIDLFEEKRSQPLYKMICIVLLVILFIRTDPVYHFFWEQL